MSTDIQPTVPENEPELLIVGLGPGDPGQISRAAWEVLQAAPSILARTRIHPTIAFLEESGIAIDSCDDLYETGESFEAVYQEVARRVLETVRQRGRLVFAVPGHPSFGERSVSLIQDQARSQGIRVRIIPSPGFLDVVLPAVGLDLSTGLAVLDAVSPTLPPPGLPAVYYQVYDSLTASELKLTLLDSLSPETLVWHVRAAGSPEEQVRSIPLHELDRLPCDHLTSVVLPGGWRLDEELFPPVSPPSRPDDPGVADWLADLDGSNPAPILPEEIDSRTPGELFDELLELMQALRSPGGCPWDREQDHRTLRRYVLEEAYEVVDCIDRDDLAHLPDELGDLLLQVVFHAQMGDEAGTFNINNVVEAICEKLIRRHPHVFGDVDVSGSDDVIRNWDAIKRAERGQAAAESTLAGIPLGLPAIARADKIFRKAAAVGFDWPAVEGPLAKVEEELAEIREAIREGNAEEITAEMGDLFLAAVNVARMLKVDPEEATRDALNRFTRRFEQMEQQAAGKPLAGLTADELDELWEAAKERLKGPKEQI